jgi:competence protein ComEA
VAQITPPLDINSADREQLISLPGIGPALADRIQANRPFQVVQDLLNVKGIGPESLEELRPYLTTDQPTPVPEIPTGEDTPPDSDSKDGARSGVEGKKASPGTALLKLPDQTTGEQQIHLNRSQLIWLLASTALIAVVVSTALVFGILSGINGTISYPDRSSLTAVRAEAAGLERQIDSVESDLSGIRERIDNLDTLTDRLESLENQVGQLESQTQAQSERLNGVEATADTFQTFLETLSQNLLELLNPNEVQNE